MANRDSKCHRERGIDNIHLPGFFKETWEFEGKKQNRDYVKTLFLESFAITLVLILQPHVTRHQCHCDLPQGCFSSLSQPDS